MLVHTSTQHLSEIQTIVAEVLHVPRNKVVVQSPRMGGGFGGNPDGLIVVPPFAPDLCAKALDGGGAARADAFMDIDHGPASGTARAPGHGTAMVAIGSAGDDEVPWLMLAGKQFDRIGAAEGLEALQAEATVLVLVEDGAQPGVGGQPALGPDAHAEDHEVGGQPSARLERHDDGCASNIKNCQFGLLN
jgi:hypothetical protein